MVCICDQTLRTGFRENYGKIQRRSWVTGKIGLGLLSELFSVTGINCVQTVIDVFDVSPSSIMKRSNTLQNFMALQHSWTHTHKWMVFHMQSPNQETDMRSWDKKRTISMLHWKSWKSEKNCKRVICQYRALWTSTMCPAVLCIFTGGAGPPYQNFILASRSLAPPKKKLTRASS
jgi:hypothetical protein